MSVLPAFAVPLITGSDVFSGFSPATITADGADTALAEPSELDAVTETRMRRPESPFCKV